MPAGTNHIHIRGTTLITSQADKLLASIKALADNGASRTLLLPDLFFGYPINRAFAEKQVFAAGRRVLSEAPE